MKKLLVVGVIVLFLGLAIAPSINANISKASIESDMVEITTEVCSFPDENADTYKFCFIISGDVEHRNFNGTFYGIPFFGIGNFQLDLLGSGQVIRLRIDRFPGSMTYLYMQDVRINLTGFIGWFQPTGGISDGLLYGFALLTIVHPL